MNNYETSSMGKKPPVNRIIKDLENAREIKSGPAYRSFIKSYFAKLNTPADISEVKSQLEERRRLLNKKEKLRTKLRLMNV